MPKSCHKFELLRVLNYLDTPYTKYSEKILLACSRCKWMSIFKHTRLENLGFMNEVLLTPPQINFFSSIDNELQLLLPDSNRHNLHCTNWLTRLLRSYSTKCWGCTQWAALGSASCRCSNCSEHDTSSPTSVGWSCAGWVSARQSLGQQTCCFGSSGLSYSQL